MVNGTESHEKNLMSYRIFIKIIIAQIIMLLMFITIKSNVDHRQNIGEIMDRLIL